MRIMHIDCSMGAAGDMLTAALYELLSAKDRCGFVDVFNSLGIPGVVMETEPSVKCGVSGTHVRMKVNGEEEGHTHGHDAHEHEHRSMKDIEHIVNDLAGLSETVRNDVMNVYKIIADAESKAHGVPVREVHFHEVGAMDAIADISAVCMLMERIGAERVTASPVNTGGGTVRCAHGILPVPAPATAIILDGIPYYSGDIQSELCTPTGAALLKHFVAEYGGMPSMTIEKEGFGMGTKDFDKPNCVKITLGEK
ncbi:MAG: LarC family nickel insertion protein [Lachnospiraceae bacterium]|nr:LarC family nickel insertion protein [Lachnospiraceae bacterium]